MKFHENILKGFQFIGGHTMIIVKFQRGTTPKMYTRVMVLVVCNQLMMLYISTKFHDNILTGFHTKFHF